MIDQVTMARVGFGGILALALILRAAGCYEAKAEPRHAILSVQSNGTELLSIAAAADGGYAEHTTAICPRDGGCKIIFVPAGAELYRTDGGWLAVPP